MLMNYPPIPRTAFDWKPFDSVMENDTCVEEKSCDGPTAVDLVKQPVSTAPFRYTKVRRIL